MTSPPKDPLAPHPQAIKTLEFLAVAAASLALLVLVCLRTTRMVPGHPLFYDAWDHHKYIAMATLPHLTDFHIAPFCWRVGTPLLVRTLTAALPMTPMRAFFAITFLCLWATAVATFYLARAFRFSRPLCWSAVLWFFACVWATKFCAFDFWLTDPPAFLATVLCISFAKRHRPIPFLITLAVGVAFKESVLFAFPLYYTLTARRLFDLRQLLRTALLTLPAVAVLLAIRLLIPAWNDNPNYLATLPENVRYIHPNDASYHYLDIFRRYGLEWFRHPSGGDARVITVGTFGLLFVLPLFSVRRNIPLLLRFLPHLFFAYLQLFFALKNNAERLLILAFPEAILMSLLATHTLARRLRTDVRWFVPLPLLVLLQHLAKSRFDLFPPAPFANQLLLFTFYLAIATQLPRLRRTARRLRM